ncbi:MAG: hypothetical protein IJF27_00525 [Oscillospiraceae bacterium]|nr:hypothetical protein [Oscillospiraceae bacterium]MBQ3049137.1 hypothetical protein [Oscillospiraceae bacterium]MBQ9938749.1 hypothetical protein [Oscillospiraceae bacterium]
MKAIICELCGSNELIKKEDYFVCSFCGTKYTLEQARKLMIDGPVDVSGSTIKVDNSAFVEKYLANARRAKMKEDWEETEKYYNMVEQNAPQNIEAVFYSSYAKARKTLQERDLEKRKAAFNVFANSISVVDDYFNKADAVAQANMVKQMSKDLLDMYNKQIITPAITGNNQNGDIYEAGTYPITKPLLKRTCDNFIESVEHIIRDNENVAGILTQCINEQKEVGQRLVVSGGGCYVATAVYGSYDCPQVWTLRRYRDYTLAESWYGRAFIHTYYAISPTLVKWFGHTEWFKNMWKGSLDRMVANLNAEGVEDTPYEDRAW